ncbi:MAG: hypothetical protein IKX45_08150 [Bacteroidales bacterium]|nr:hypothetical protein [Bacteroidales bacterium]
MNTKLTYTAPECELVFTEQAVPLCQSTTPDLVLNPLEDDTTTITWD